MECLVECDSTAPHQIIPLLTFLSEDHLTKRSPDLKMVFKVWWLTPHLSRLRTFLSVNGLQGNWTLTSTFPWLPPYVRIISPREVQTSRWFKAVLRRVSDPHWFNADPDPDPAFLLIADPDPGSGSRLWWSKIEKNLQLEILFKFFWSKIATYLSLGLHKGRQSYRRNLQPSKENI